MVRKKIVFIISLLFILPFVANAQIIGFRLAANSGVLLTEFGSADVPIYPEQNPAQSTERFSPQPTIGFEGEILFQVSPNSFFGIEGDYTHLKGVNDNPPNYNYFYTPYFQNFQDELYLSPIKYNTHLWNLAVNYKYFFFEEKVFQPFIKLTGVVSFVGTEMSYKDMPDASLESDILYARGTSNSDQKKWPVFHVGGGVGFSYDLTDHMAFQVDGTATVINSGIVNGVPNFTYVQENGEDLLRYNRRLSLTMQISVGLVYTFEIERGGSGEGQTSPELPFYRRKK